MDPDLSCKSADFCEKNPLFVMFWENSYKLYILTMIRHAKLFCSKILPHRSTISERLNIETCEQTFMISD